MQKRLGIVLIAGLALAGCAGRQQAAGPDGIADPYEPLNRKVHAFNTGVDRVLFKARPGAPQTVDNGVTRSLENAGANLSLPGKVIDSLLQGRPEPAVKNTFRFVINTTLGIGGLFDPAAASFSLPEIDTDFGETLAVWGVGEGAYVELPLLGPSTGRDAVGRVVDMAMNPLGTVLEGSDATAATTVRIAGKVAARKRYGGLIESILYGSADSYAQSRLMYLQMRRHQLAGKENQDALAMDPYEDPNAQ
jgi:phospholipid-binding lipoprotein MlaA